MEILNNFGFEPTFFIAQIINFLILAFIFKKFLYKPILKVLHDREQKIAHGIKEAEDARLALEAAEAKQNEIIKKATLTAEKIIDETKNQAGTVREELTQIAKNEADKIIKEAKMGAAAEFERAAREAQDAALDISKNIVEKILSEIFTKDEKEKIIKRNIKILDTYE